MTDDTSGDLLSASTAAETDAEPQDHAAATTEPTDAGSVDEVTDEGTDEVTDEGTATASADEEPVTGSTDADAVEASADSASPLASARPDAAETATDGRWRTGLLFALAAAGGGVAAGSTGLFLAAIVGLAYAGYATASSPPLPTLVVTREVETLSPAPGDVVTVTVTVRNAGEAPLPDVRVADQPPADLPVVDGEPRHAATVEPGEVVAFAYDLRVVRGKHAFDDLVTVARSASGAAARRERHAGGDELVCYAPVDAMDLAPQAGQGAGRVETDRGGEGIEFYATRQYDSNDPVSRIDWNRYAATGDLATVVYRESHAATVVFVLDARKNLRPGPDEPSAVELGGYATVRIADALVDAANSVGLAVVDTGFDERVVDRLARSREVDSAWYLRPDSGTEQSLRVRRFLEWTVDVEVDELAGARTASGDDPAGEDTAADDDATVAADASTLGQRVSGLWSRVPGDAQVVFVSPLLDETAVAEVERVAASGRPVTVVSPDVTDGSTGGGAVERIERAERIRSLRTTANVRVVDWDRDDPLQRAVGRDSAGWNR